jgi:hypothetical protein
MCPHPEQKRKTRKKRRDLLIDKEEAIPSKILVLWLGNPSKGKKIGLYPSHHHT